MINLTFLICLLISAMVIFLVIVKPLFLMELEPYYGSSVKEELFDESLSVLETLKELESDFKMGKLSSEDYNSLSLEYKRLYLEKKATDEA